MNCDNCSHYCWYYDHCDKWDCEVDGREVHDCFEPYFNRASGTGTCTEVEQVMNKLPTSQNDTLKQTLKDIPPVTVRI